MCIGRQILCQVRHLDLLTAGGDAPPYASGPPHSQRGAGAEVPPWTDQALPFVEVGGAIEAPGA